MMKARIALVVAIAAIMISVAVASPVQAAGFYRIDSTMDGETYIPTGTPIIQQISTTVYTDVGKANARNTRHQFVGALPGGGLEYIEGDLDLVNPTWTFDTVGGATTGVQYSRVTANRGGARNIYAARAGTGMDMISGGPGSWTVTDVGGAHYNDVSPGGDGYFVYLAPDTGPNGSAYIHGAGPPVGYMAGTRYTDMAVETRDPDYAAYGYGAGGIDYVGWAANSPVDPPWGNITTTLYNDITGVEKADLFNGFQTVFGAITGGGIESHNWIQPTGPQTPGYWQQRSLTTAGDREYSILWYDWGSPFEPAHDPEVLYGAGANGGLWMFDANDANPAVQLVSPSTVFTVLVGNTEKGGIIYGVTDGDPVVPEPGSLAALGMGMISLFGFAVRRRK